MKANIERGRGFRGALEYAFGKDGGNACELVGGNMHGTNPRELAAEFALSRQARTSVGRPVFHVSLALPPGDEITSDKWSAIADDFIAEMGLQKHQYAVIRHHDTDHAHIHIIASRIALDGSVWHGKNDVFLAIEATQKLEVKHGLRHTKGFEGRAEVKHPSRGEVEASLRTGEPIKRLELQKIIDAATENGPRSVVDFIERCEAAGVNVRVNMASTGKLNGMSFEYAGVAFKGSDLGKAYAWGGLQKRGVKYDQTTESSILVRWVRRAESSIDRAGPGPVHSVHQGSSDIAQVCGDGVQSRPERVPGERNNSNPELGTPSEGSSREAGKAERPSSKDANNQLGADQRDEGIPAGNPTRSEEDQNDMVGIDVHARSELWRHAADTADAELAKAYPLPVGVGSQHLTPSHRTKLRAWDKQHNALKSELYRITCRARVEGSKPFVLGNRGRNKEAGDPEKFFTYHQVAEFIPELSDYNRKGHDIYLTPIDSKHFYLLVDDLTSDKLQELIKEGYTPALVQESSDNNCQAVIIVEKNGSEEQKKAADALVSDLNTRLGDPNCKGAIRPFRMAGFSNKKPGRNDAFTRIIKATGELCAKSAGIVWDAAKALAEKARKTRGTGATAASRTSGTITPTDGHMGALARFQEYRAWLVKQVAARQLPPDASALDFDAARSVFRAGYLIEHVVFAIKNGSPDLSVRHEYAEDKYAERTAKNAQKREQDAAKGVRQKDEQPKRGMKR